MLQAFALRQLEQLGAAVEGSGSTVVSGAIAFWRVPSARPRR
jgi:hypothetical protein